MCERNLEVEILRREGTDRGRCGRHGAHGAGSPGKGRLDPAGR